MRHVCKDTSQRIHPEPSDEGSGERKKENETQWLVSKQVQRSLGSDSIGTGLRVQSSARSESSVGFM